MTSNFSFLLFQAMDCIGFSREMILSRANTCCKMYETFSKNGSEHFGMDLILTGSKSEGIALLNASDNDLMLIPRNCVCVDKGCQENDVIVLEARAKDCPPGYTQVRLLNEGNTCIPDAFYMASEYDIVKGVLLLKSTGIKQVFALVSEKLPQHDGIERKCKTPKGPSCPVVAKRTDFFGVTSAKIYNDHVPAITYYSLLVLTEWKERIRQNEWPPSSLIEEVSTMEGYVVPVGHKLSEEQNFEWRICYRKLITSLYETQLKMYIVLKMVNKFVIKPVVGCVTSYMIKNIVLWITECSPQNVQSHSYLTRVLIQGLRLLLHCLNNNHLPNYMIPSRNLLLGKIESDKKQRLIQCLSELLNDGECIVLRCPKLKNAVHFVANQRSLASSFQTWRDEVEKLILAINLKLATKTSPEMAYRSSFLYDMSFELWKDETYLESLFRLFNLMNVDVSTLLLNGMQNIQFFLPGLRIFFHRKKS